MAKRYSFENVKVNIGGVPVVGFTEGDDVVAIEYLGEGITTSVGADGNVTFNESCDKTCQLTIKLQGNSMTNTELQKFFDKAEEFTVGIVNTSEGNETDETTISEARVTKVPNKSFGANIGTREWVIVGKGSKEIIGIQ